MKLLPSTLEGWIIFYLFWITTIVIAAWVMKGLDLPQGVANVVIAVVSGFLGFLTGRKSSDAVPLPGSTITTDSTTTVTTPEEK